jgi:hypothetical protein
MFEVAFKSNSSECLVFKIECVSCYRIFLQTWLFTLTLDGSLEDALENVDFYSIS